MTDEIRPRIVLQTLDDAGLEAALRAVGAALAMPTSASATFAGQVTNRILADRPARAGAGWSWSPLRLRRSTVLAIAATLILAAAAVAAIGFNLPGLRIIFGPPPSLPPTASPGTSVPHLPGSLLGLGTIVSADEAQRLVDFELVLPTDPDLGPPAATYVRLGRVAFVWGPTPDLPATTDPEIGLLLNEFHGSYEETIVKKVAPEGTEVEPVTVGGAAGYWIDGAVHFFMYLDPSGKEIEDTYRTVGHTLVWTRAGITYRLETGLDRDAAIRLAESLR